MKIKLIYTGIKTCCECGYSNILPFTIIPFDRFTKLTLSKTDGNLYHTEFFPKGHEVQGLNKVYCKSCAIKELDKTIKNLKLKTNEK